MKNELSNLTSCEKERKYENYEIRQKGCKHK